MELLQLCSKSPDAQALCVLATASAAITRSYTPFPQAKSLNAALLSSQLLLLGQLLGVVTEPNAQTLLQMMTTAAGNASKARRQQPEEARTAIVVSICGAALAGLTVMAKRCRGERIFRSLICSAENLCLKQLPNGSKLQGRGHRCRICAEGSSSYATMCMHSRAFANSFLASRVQYGADGIQVSEDHSELAKMIYESKDAAPQT